MIHSLLDDFRQGFRQLLRRPGFALAAIASLALGIGANTVLFGVLNRVMFGNLPGIADPARVVDLGRGSHNESFDTFAAPDLDDIRASVPALDHVFGFRLSPLNIRVTGSPERAVGYEVSEEYFETLGARMALGRAFTANDRATLAADPGVVLSDAAWRRYFGADPNVVDRAFSINGASFRVLGVAVPEFRGHIVALSPDVFVPLSTSPLINSEARRLLTQREARWLLAGGRLAPGATLDQLRTQLDTLAARLAQAYPSSHEHLRLSAAPLAPLPAAAHQAVTLFSGVMFALVGLILVMACVNVAGMLLARGEMRRGELALRVALGAARGRIVRQLFAEGLVLALLAGAAGLFLAGWLRGLLVLVPLPAPIPVDLSVPLDGNVFAFATLASIGTALLAALWPAWRLSQRDPRNALGAAGAGQSHTRTRTRNALVVVQLAVSLVLLVAAGLFLRSLGRAADVDPGFRAEGVSYAEFDLQPAGYDDARALGVADALLDQVRAIPGVHSAASVAMLPLSLNRMGMGAARTEPESKEFLDPNVNTLSPGYFDTLGIALLRGRDFDRTDAEGAESVAIVNRTLAQQLFGEQDALGRTFQLGEGTDWRTLRVIGLTGDGKYASLNESGTPFLYLPVRQWPRQSQHLVMRADVGPAELERALRGALAAVDANLPPLSVHPLTDVTALSVLPQRIAGYVATVLGMLGLLLAATGLYGVLALYVAQRRREIGVRLALGATRANVVRTVATRAARLVAIGIGIGAVLAVGLAQALESLLFGIGPSDALALIGAIAVLALGAALAILGPAWRAARVDPMAALRYE